MRSAAPPFIMFDKAFESLGKAAADTRLKFEQAAARSRAKLRIDHINQQIRIMHNKISTLTVAMLNMTHSYTSMYIL